MSNFLKMTASTYFTEEMVYKAFMQYYERPLRVHLVEKKDDALIYLVEFPNINEARRVYKKLNKRVIEGVIPYRFFTFETAMKTQLLKPRKLYPEYSNYSTSSRNHNTVEFGEGISISTSLIDILNEDLSKPSMRASIIPQENSDSPTSYSVLNFVEHKSYQIFVHLGCSVTQVEVYSVFAKLFPTCISARVICDRCGCSKNFGFVEFNSKTDQQRALQIRDGQIRIRGESVIVREAYSTTYKRRNYIYNQKNTGVRKTDECQVYEDQPPSNSNSRNTIKNISFHPINNSSEKLGTCKEQPTTSLDISSNTPAASVLFFKGFTKGDEQTNNFESKFVALKASSNEHLSQSCDMINDCNTAENILNINKRSFISVNGEVETENPDNHLTVNLLSHENIHTEEVIPIIYQSKQFPIENIRTNSNSNLEEGVFKTNSVLETTFNKNESELNVNVNDIFENIATMNDKSNLRQCSLVDTIEVNKEALIDEENNLTNEEFPTTTAPNPIQYGNQVEVRNGMGLVRSVAWFLMGVFLLSSIITSTFCNSP
ncbi:uncharacterized protein LOC119686139 [Teleopsis dalmanni]|uniref:uncharacterized protein LOC119686139 n=1 Tax=Teleopsis dalmanni TaxID=139649 RepID=UPI0018CECA1D|nr:uncharacterized protein LOC119686139 [Teleopsis dalmanni]